ETKGNQERRVHQSRPGAIDGMVHQPINIIGEFDQHLGEVRGMERPKHPRVTKILQHSGALAGLGRLEQNLKGKFTLTWSYGGRDMLYLSGIDLYDFKSNYYRAKTSFNGSPINITS
ncbi:hypothetical protein HAX54_014249, partial [Datura stramonium]|nr:hypothetical protein [Datura stramonium]